MKPIVVGSFYWATGPLVLGSSAAQKRLQRDRHRPSLTALAKVKKAAPHALGTGKVFVLPGQLPGTWVPLGKDAGVLVRVAGHTMKPKDALSIDPWTVPDHLWEQAVSEVSLDAKSVLFDAVSHHPEGPVKGADSTCIAIGLPKGVYVVDRAAAGDRDFQVELFRFRPRDWQPTPPKTVTRAPGPPADPSLRSETVALAKKLKFVSSEEGGSPVIACPTSLLPSWKGIDGGDFDRACDVRGHVLKVGKGQALVFETDSVAFVQEKPDLAYAFIWIGADDGSHVIEAVRSAPESSWKKTKETFTMVGSTLGLLDAANEGTRKPAFVGTLASGRYSIETMKEFSGLIRVGKKRHELLASGLRLKRLGTR